VKTLQFATSRLFLSNYTKGYNAPTSNQLSGEAVLSSGSTTLIPVVKAFSTYQLAIQFRDKSKRRCSVVTAPEMIVNIPDRTLAYTTYTTGILWSLTAGNELVEIPDWAYYYDILITKNLRTRNFVSAKNLVFQYAKKNADGTFVYQSTYDTSVYGLAISLFVLNNQGIGYVFEEGSGDLARIYLLSGGIFTLPVLAQDANNVILAPRDLGTLTGVLGTYEIYTPYKQSGTEIFYTTGQSFLVTNPTLPSRTYSTLFGTISGDVYRSFDYNIEQMSPNNDIEWNTWTNYFGETNIQSLLGQVDKTNFISYSNVLIQGSSTNGLSTFDSLDEKSLPDEMGAINKLQLADKIQEQGTIMLAIGQNETASLYLGEVQLVGASANAFIASSPGVIGTVNVLKGNYGTQHPETVIEYLGLVFGFDANNGVWWQYSNAGLEPISRYKMSRFFQRYSKDYLAASSGNLDNINGFHHIPSGIDPFHKELVCGLPGLIYENYATTLPSYSSVPSYATSIINRFDVYDQLQKDMIFNILENKWGSNRNYGAEWYEYVENKMFGWKNGVMYEHNADTTNWNTFYGVQQPIRLCFTCNINPSALKVLNNIALESSVIPDFTVALTALPNIQITDLTDDDYTNQEANMYAQFFCDRLSPNASGTADEKLYTGDSLTDFSIFVMCEFQQYTGLAWVQFANIGFSVSRGQKAISNPING